jgi:6-phospho-3-hexuloisomerase
MEFREYKHKILEELNQALSAVDSNSADALIDLLLSARKVFVLGVGRVQLSLLSMVKRLNHLGIDAIYVGAVNEPAITSEDVLIVGSGSGESVVPVALTKIAKQYGAKIVYIGSNASSRISEMADLMIRIPCRTKLSLEDELTSIQPMSSLFEQSLLLFGDILACMLIERQKLDLNTLWQRHANLE